MLILYVRQLVSINIMIAASNLELTILQCIDRFLLSSPHERVNDTGSRLDA